MDTTSLMLSMLFGTIGLGFLMYGKKAGRAVPMICGALLMFIPYFVSNNYAMSGVCVLISSVPFILRNA